MAAGRGRKRGARVARANKTDLDRLEVWTPYQASDWSGINYRQLLRLFRAGKAPCIIGEPARPTSGDRRVYLVPRQRFQEWLRTGEATAITTGATAA